MAVSLESQQDKFLQIKHRGFHKLKESGQRISNLLEIIWKLDIHVIELQGRGKKEY